MIKSFFNQLTGISREKLKARSRRTHLAIETLESRDVPSIFGAPNASDLAPVVTLSPILDTKSSDGSYTGTSPIAGSHTITSPNGLSTVTIINETNGDVPASPGSSSTAQVFENGTLVWQQSGALVGEALFSPNSQHLALVVDTSSGWEVIEDGNLVGSGYSSVSTLTFSQDGNDLAFITYEAGAGFESDGYAVVENGSVVSSTYYAIGDLQFNSPGDQLRFTGYQSQTEPGGPGIALPMVIALNYAQLAAPGEWGYAASAEGAVFPTPTDPVTVDLPSGATTTAPASNTGAPTPANPVQNPSQPAPTAPVSIILSSNPAPANPVQNPSPTDPVSNSTPPKIIPTNTVTVSKTVDPSKIVTSHTTASTSGSHKPTSSGATKVDSKAPKYEGPKGNNLVVVAPGSPPPLKGEAIGTPRSNSSGESGGSTSNSSNPHELGIVEPLFDHTEVYLSPVLVDASQSTKKDEEED